MVSLKSVLAALVLGAGTVSFASPTPFPDVPVPVTPPANYCDGVQNSPGGQPCGGTDIMNCPTLDTWSCPNGQSGAVPPGTQCICSAFRNPGWIPNSALPNPDGSYCYSGIVCVVEGGTKFRVCGISGLEPEQDTAPGTVCRNGGITWP